MVSSMTGFGRSTCQSVLNLTAEFKSVNHRYLDLTLNLPSEILYLEEGIKREISSFFKRGKITGYITFTGSALTNSHIQINWPVFEQYETAMVQLRERLGQSVRKTLELRDWIQLPNLFKTVETPIETADFESEIMATIRCALQNLSEMRLKEGAFLKKEILDRLVLIEQGLDRIQNASPKIVEAYQKRLEERIRSLLTDQVDLDEARLINEVAIFAEKTDITEESARLVSHLEQFKQILDQEGPIGRQLDFLMQEMNREVNTMGSKSPDIFITREVIGLKSELEKIREQLQNLE